MPPIDSDLTAIDPKFEHYWNGDAAEERRLISEVAAIIRDFVEKSAATRRLWHEDYERLRADAGHGRPPHGKDADRLAAYERIFADLPDRSNDRFATRDVHRKTHGCFKARVTIDPGLDPAFAKGLFVPGTAYDAVVRFSNGNPRNQDDYAPDARGMAVKLLPDGTLDDGLDLAQMTAPELNAKGLLDILTINFPTFFVDDPRVYAQVNTRFLAHHDDVLDGHKLDEVLSVAIGGMSGIEKNLALKVNGSIILNLLYQQWFSMAPSRLGAADDPERTAVKYMIEPSGGGKGGPDWPDWSTWEEGRNYQVPLVDVAKIPHAVRSRLQDEPDYLRAALEQTLAAGPFRMDLKLQPFLSAEDTPVENSTEIWHWSEAEKEAWLGDALSLPLGGLSRRRAAAARRWRDPVTLGVLEIRADGGRAGNSRFCEDLSFNPWNNVPDAHRPLGIIQRVKRAAYDASRTTRFAINDVASPFPPLPTG